LEYVKHPRILGRAVWGEMVHIGLCVIRQQFEVKPHDSDPSDNYDTVDLEMNARDPHTVRTFQDDNRKVWDILSNMCAKHPCWVYIKPAQRGKNGRLAYELIFHHYLGPNNVGNMANDVETSYPALSKMAKKEVHLGNLCANLHRAALRPEWPEGVWILWH
jgi:hypothetical protein